MRERHRARERAESNLVGRRWELSAVESLLERAIDGHGAVVGVVGSPGIGKSRLVREVSAIAGRRGVEVFTTFCESHTSQVPCRASTCESQTVAEFGCLAMALGRTLTSGDLVQRIARWEPRSFWARQGRPSTRTALAISRSSSSWDRIATCDLCVISYWLSVSTPWTNTLPKRTRNSFTPLAD
jgi:hypothetical protein